MDYFIRKLIDSFGIFFRTIRAFFSRRIMGLSSRFRQLTNFSRNATKVANASFQGAAAAVKKPTKREDYIETQRLFISKSFIVYLVIGIVLVGLFCYFVAWPFILSHFLTAKFYVRDDRVEDWTGKVIVYSDKSKKKPLYAGRLEDGLLQGQGKEYDEDGLLEFEGAFVDGVRTGSGKSYKAGVLAYEGGFGQGKYQGSGTLYEDGLPLYQGRFEEGVYEGTGKLFSEGAVIYEGQFHEGLYEGAGTTYEDGKPVYKGTFSAGVPEGTGILYEDGVKRYEGDFSDGEFSGEGKLFFPDGTVEYKGGFAGGEYDGEGTEYREDGSVAYSGGYAGGEPAGAGTVTLENGDKIESTFTNGVGDGMIQWYKNGRLWYEGSAADLTPDGFGAIYAESGKIVYQGSMDMGCIDGPWLLTLTANELREAFAQANVTESERNGGGFLMTNEDLGLMVLCTYRSDEGESSAYRIWLFPAADSIHAQLLPWSTREEAENWAVEDREGFIRMSRSWGGIFSPDGGADGNWSQSVAYFTSYNQSLIARDEDEVPFGIVWALVGGTDAPEISTVDEAISQAQEKLEQLLAELDKVTAGMDSDGGDEPGGDQPGGDQPGSDQPGGDQPGSDQPGGDQPGSDQPGGDQPGSDQPGSDQPGSDQPGSDQPGGDQPGGNQPGSDQPGGDQPGGDQPGGDQPGGDQPGGDQPGGNQPGSDQPGGDQPGGNQPGSDQPGGNQPGGDQPGSDQPGGDQPGGNQPGGDQPGSDQPGGDQPGGNQPGSDQPGGDQPGSDQPGGNQPGSDQPGGDQPGGNQPGSDQPGGNQPGGDQPGGDQPGSDQPGSDQPGGDQPGGDQPSGDEPGGNQPGSDQPGGNQPGGEQSGGTTPGGDPRADVEALLKAVKDMDQAKTLMGALINAYAYGQAITSLEAARPLRASMLEEQKVLRDKGLSTDEAVNELQDSLDTMDHQLYQYNIMRKQADITVESLTGKSVEGLDLSDILLAVNTGSVNVDLLYADALQYAKDIAAGRYEVDEAQLLADVKVKLLDLTIAYDNIERGRSALEKSRKALERITDSYSRGEAEKADLYAAQCAVSDAVSSLYQTIASYTRTFNDLNDMSGGWMAREFDWYPDPFGPLKEASIAKAREEAKKAAENAAGAEDGEGSGQTDGAGA